uniref:Uncharacterized protein n=1 Tax=Aegilops tauschii subsp. strangulata TaxID=200361 RepID=A0A453GA57_AEGTS
MSTASQCIFLEEDAHKQYDQRAADPELPRIALCSCKKPPDCAWYGSGCLSQNPVASPCRRAHGEREKKTRARLGETQKSKHPRHAALSEMQNPSIFTRAAFPVPTPSSQSCGIQTHTSACSEMIRHKSVLPPGFHRHHYPKHPS